MKNRTVHDLDHHSRLDQPNNRTVLLDVAERYEQRAFVDVFVDGYRELRRCFRHALEPGVLLCSIDGLGGGAGYVSLRTDDGGPAVAIIGRHCQADLRLHRDPQVSLRHIAAIVRSDGGVLLLDLNTGQGFEDERGVRQLAVLADGPVFLRCGRYVVFVLPSALARRMPKDPLQAWGSLPRREYLEHTPLPERAPPGREPTVPQFVRTGVTCITSIPAPRPTRQAMLGPGEQPLGELMVSTPGGCELIQVGASALRQGVLVGRYGRCATSVIRDGELDQVSRVHLLVIQLDGAIYAIDTASTNGTWFGEVQVRGARLEHGTLLTIGTSKASVEWRLLN